jgi:hypothetical protein
MTSVTDRPTCSKLSRPCTFLSHQNDTGQTHNIVIGNKSFESVTDFELLGMTVTDQNYIHDKVNFRNIFYHSVQNLLHSCSHLQD